MSPGAIFASVLWIDDDDQCSGRGVADVADLLADEVAYLSWGGGQGVEQLVVDPVRIGDQSIESNTTSAGTRARSPKKATPADSSMT